jgi:ribonuclease P protein component
LQTELISTPTVFPKQARLLCPKDYQDVFVTRKVLKTRFFRVHLRKKSEGAGRLGIVVAKKKCKLANKRNRVKRIARESFRMNRHLIGQFDVVLVVDKYNLLTENQAFFDDLMQLWKTLANYH